MLNSPFRHLNLNIEMEVSNWYQCTINTKKKKINKKTPEESKQTNPDSRMFFKYIHPVFFSRSNTEAGKSRKVAERGELVGMRCLGGLSRNVMCEPYLDPDSDKVITKMHF